MLGSLSMGSEYGMLAKEQARMPTPELKVPSQDSLGKHVHGHAQMGTGKESLQKQEVCHSTKLSVRSDSNTLVHIT